MSKSVVLPSFPAPSFAALEECLRVLQGTVATFQVDIVDEVFSTHAPSWPETEEEPLVALQGLAPYIDTFRFEFDLMVSDPVPYIEVIEQLGVADVVLHAEEVALAREIEARVVARGGVCSVAFTPDTPRSTVETFLETGEFSHVQYMGIKEVGAQGQPFDERVLEEISWCKTTFPAVRVTVDGAVSEKTIEQLQAAGADRFAPGSAVVKAEDPVAAYKQLVALVS